MKYKYEVDIYTDGACKGNPGPGGWAAVLLVKDPPAKKVIQGGQLQTTNNQMEIKAIIEGIKVLKMLNQKCNQICHHFPFLHSGRRLNPLITTTRHRRHVASHLMFQQFFINIHCRQL